MTVSPSSVRRRRLAWAVLIAAVGIMCTACTLDSRPPRRPFDELVVTVSGGIDGRSEELVVSADGTALLMSRRSRAGRIDAATMDRLQTLVASEDFRTEVARAAQVKVPVCPDQLRTTLIAGDLSIEQAGSCGGVEDVDTPVLDQILSLLGPALDGRFDRPLGTDEPLAPIRLERHATSTRPGYVLTAGADGQVSRVVAGAAPATARLAADDRDVLGLLVERIGEPGVEPCPSGERYVVTIGRTTGPDCGFGSRSREIRAVIDVLESAVPG